MYQVGAAELLAQAAGEVAVEHDADVGPQPDELFQTGAADHRRLDGADGGGAGGVRCAGEQCHLPQAFAGSETLKDAMAGAGLAGPPTIWFAKVV